MKYILAALICGILILIFEPVVEFIIKWIKKNKGEQ